MNAFEKIKKSGRSEEGSNNLRGFNSPCLTARVSLINYQEGVAKPDPGAGNSIDLTRFFEEHAKNLLTLLEECYAINCVAPS